AFAGASIEFIRRFETDYAAKPSYLVENYRSTKAIISAANRVIAPAANRMKNGHDIAIDRARAGLNDGGQMEALDPVAKGRVQVLQCAGDHEAQATAAID